VSDRQYHTAGITLPQAAEPCHEGGKNTLASGVVNFPKILTIYKTTV